MKIAITCNDNGSSVYYENVEHSQKVDGELIGYTTPKKLLRMQEAFKKLTKDQRLMLSADADDFLWMSLWNPDDAAIDSIGAQLVMDSTMTFTEKNTATPTSEMEQTETFIQPKLTGYSQLTKEQADLMNEGKALAEQCGAFIEKLKLHGPQYSPPDGYSPGLEPLLDQRWVSIGQTELQKAWMFVMRSIAQPTSF